MTIYQNSLPFNENNPPSQDGTYRDKLIQILAQDLNFHSQHSGYASHNFHSFPAKFPPQLPRTFIEALTHPGDIVLDPMMGSGTTILEAWLAGRRGIGADIDPLALLLSKVKVTPLDVQTVIRTGNTIVENATSAVRENHLALSETLKKQWDAKTRTFIDYWFAPETQIELTALRLEIEKIDDPAVKSFFQIIFSTIIITKSGGVSLAFDLAHTRPHRAKVVLSKEGAVLIGQELRDNPSPRIRFLTKTLRSPITEFKKRFQQNVRSLPETAQGKIPPATFSGNAQWLALADHSADLIVTSPPYASNAIDYMRAHKFSLAWMGLDIDKLGAKRREYIGGEFLNHFEFEKLPEASAAVVADIRDCDEKKARVLHRYYSEMTRTLREMFRVLRPGKAAIVVVGSSVMRGRDTRTQHCLADIGRAIGFEVPGIGVRSLDRNKRMMPVSANGDKTSQIQQRMHEEYVIGFYKTE
ncbi:hypothetical protein DENIS_1399 [Desulfonema ishimotonii]|uniref:Methyltransferase n=1 Tax=Desulfonema ishimotonii TaxID=45657 RepID=A0A401FU00_9BACT|nr:DNA methyltransferase [Desulfonema ishimotonii]GBC60446.1 hypothetical protein DENIS_1399 [Desulfonema ishimotonii]